MEYTCFNCESNLELPIVTDDPWLTEQCEHCGAQLELNNYRICPFCRIYYFKNLPQCPLCEESIDKNIIIPSLKYTYIETEVQYREALEFIKQIPVLGLDTEGNSLDPFTNELFLIQLGTAHGVYVFDFRSHERLAKETFWQDPEKVFIVHNAKYDYKVLKQSCGITLNNIYDTMLAERVITCGKSRQISLKDVISKYFSIEIEKESRDDFIQLHKSNFLSRLTLKMIEYAARDVQLLPLIRDLQRTTLRHEQLDAVAELEFKVARVVAEIELRGIYIDREKWQTLIDQGKTKRDEITQKIQEKLISDGFETNLFGNTQVNLNSTPSLKKLFTHYHIDLESTDDEHLAKIKHPLADLIRDYRTYEKQLSSFGKNMLELIHPKTGRIHPSYQQIGADTGRFSCTNPNLQQIPATDEFRSCFTAPAGRKLVTCDYSQQELRVLASLSGDKKFIQMYKDGVDLHSATAAMMFKIPLEKVEKHKHRKIAKTINFGLAYGRGAKSLAEAMGVSEDEAEDMINRYFAQFSSIREWLERVAKDAQTTGVSKTLLGRKRYYHLPESRDPEYRGEMSSIGRQGKNTPIQGSGADMVKIALVLIHDELLSQQLDAFLVNTVHDEIVVESSIADSEATAKIVENCMVKAGEKLVKNVPIVAECAINDYWKH